MLQRFFKWFTAKQAAPLSLYQEAVRKWQGMISPTHAVYRDIRCIEVVFPTIDEYTQELQRVCSAINGHRLYASLSVVELKEISRDRFYLDRKQNYLEVETAHDRFKTVAIETLELYERKENEELPTGLTQANLHRTLPIINNLISLAEAFNP